MKRLALFLDGTWNDPGSHTNVIDLRDLVCPGVVNGVEQLRYYDPGVGTDQHHGLLQRWKDKLIGGAFGEGLSKNVRDAYQFLVDHYDDGDEIYLFGFSRGAYTARSIAGVIIRCGLLRRTTPAPLTVQQLYDRYRRGKDAVALYDLIDQRLPPGYSLTPEDREFASHSRRVDLHFVGVWDTVGALGIPWTEAPLIGRGNFYFHDTNLSVLIKHAYHALAVDEHRGPFKPTLWTQYTPDPNHQTPPADRPTQGPGGHPVEQRWFIGAHSNVGGGYPGDALRQWPYAWLQSKSQEAGLQFTGAVQTTGTEYRTRPVDSFAAFMGGFYKLIRFGKRFERPIDSGPQQVKGGWSTPINEWIDGSVFQRYREFSDYRPANLIDWATRKGVALETQNGPRSA